MPVAWNSLGLTVGTRRNLRCRGSHERALCLRSRASGMVEARGRGCNKGTTRTHRSNIQAVRPLLSQDAARPWMFAWRLPMQQQRAGMQRMRLSNEKRLTIEGKSKISEYQASLIDR